MLQVLIIAEMMLMAEPRVPSMPVVATFSIVAFDPAQHEWAVGVQSRVLAVGSIVPYAQAGVGAVATQSWANTTFGPEGLRLLADKRSADETLRLLLDADAGRQHRQVAIIDRQGRIAAFSGSECLSCAGIASGPNYSCQGNLLAGPEVVTAMASAFEKATGPLAYRVMAALTAGQMAGGDRRGQQSAGLLVVRDKAGYGGFNDRLIDLRVDDHDRPIAELERLLQLRWPRPRRTSPAE